MLGMRRRTLALLVALITGVIGFYLMIYADIAWAQWRDPNSPNSMAGIGGFGVGLATGPVCGALGYLLVLKLIKPRNSR
jgi:hypothetical protein